MFEINGWLIGDIIATNWSKEDQYVVNGFVIKSNPLFNPNFVAKFTPSANREKPVQHSTIPHRCGKQKHGYSDGHKKERPRVF